VTLQASGTDGERKDNLRSKPLSGKLQVTLKGARELDHAPIVTSGKSRSSSKQIRETFISLKIEGTQRARSLPSRTDRWNEDFEMIVDKANEVEIAVYDKQIGELHPVLIGLLWIRISDLVEASRRQKVLMESGQGGWVTAGAMGGGLSPYSGSFSSSNLINDGSGPNAMAFDQPEGVEAWFSVEPAGALALRLNFGKLCYLLPQYGRTKRPSQSKKTCANVR
jgi:C2 domain